MADHVHVDHTKKVNKERVCSPLLVVVMEYGDLSWYRNILVEQDPVMNRTNLTTKKHHRDCSPDADLFRMSGP